MATVKTSQIEDSTTAWRSIAARAAKLFKSEIGGTDLRHKMLSEIGGLATSKQSLDQLMRPTGRNAHDIDKLVRAFARVFANKLHCGREDVTVKELEAAYVGYLRTGIPVPVFTPQETVNGASGAKGGALATALWSLDLWTPGQSIEAISQRFLADLGPDGALRAAELSRDAIDAIGRGDFEQQERLADDAITLGASAPTTPLAGEGLYLKAEALRLRADFEPDRMKARQLRTEAEQLYGQAEDALRGDPRAIRGRARTIEVLGDLDGALVQFDRSISAVAHWTAASDGQDLLSLAHERVRSLRHKLSCMAAMQEQAPLATGQARQRAEVIRDLIAQSEPQHREALELFKDHGDWWRIEWFMAQVLHAKGWASIGDGAVAATRLRWSLDMRLKLLPSEGPLSPVELGNLHWWSGIAGKGRASLDRAQRPPLEALIDAINHGSDRTTIHEFGHAFLRAGEAPWS